jgi:uncharacterized protein YcfJ
MMKRILGSPCISGAQKSTELQRYGRAYQQPAQQLVAQTNYLGIGTGALIGVLLGNQGGGGNGRALATVAGLIGGGFLGNEVEKRAR